VSAWRNVSAVVAAVPKASSSKRAWSGVLRPPPLGRHTGPFPGCHGSARILAAASASEAAQTTAEYCTPSLM
jgi:hypothetical protein